MLSTNVDYFYEMIKLFRDNSVTLLINRFLETTIYLKITELYYIVDFFVDDIKLN